MQYHLPKISALSYIHKFNLIALAGDTIKIINLQKEKEQQEIKTQRFLRIFQLIFNEQDNNLYQFNDNKTIVIYKQKGRNFILDKQFSLEYDFYPTLATISHDNQTIILAGMDTHKIVFYNLINQCLTKIELPNTLIQNYCLLYNKEKRCLLTQNCLINVGNQKIIKQVITQFSKLRGWSQTGYLYSKQISQKVHMISSFKQKILRIISEISINPSQVFSQTGKYYCFQNRQEQIELFDISTGISYFSEMKLLNCQNLQFHENDQTITTILSGRSVYILNVNQIINNTKQI
ncbi:unnamed protein product [Paramecium sonneborni]|uniref:Uncharacterized protein n=1 Tax=Paramecium sonneborni TaxID=65129 RepID=A0A8S1KAE6_9CILI|nr:unnamed protein product [Paramecium sonneborni]